jgi:glycerophosphoryl diester phosphodiesterase
MATPTIIAHRGLHDEHPENSLKAFLAAWEAGIEWCECDVRGSFEHEPFVFHDATLERMTDSAGPITAVPSSELHRLNLRRADGAVSASCIPRLSALIASMPPRSKLLIEIKPQVHADVVRRTLDLCDPQTCVVQSFDVAVLETARAHRGEIRRELLVDENVPSHLPGLYRAVNFQFKNLTPEIVDALRVRGLEIGAWTVNLDADIRRILSLGVHTIISDQALRVRDIVSQIG